MSGPHQLVGRVVSILQAFSEGHTVLSLKQVAEHSGLPPSTAHRLLEQLVAHGMIDRWPQRRYCVGAELVRISAMVSTKVRLAEIARPLMLDIARRTEMTCLLSLYVPSRLRRIPISRIDPRGPFAYKVLLPDHQSLVWGAAGRVILAYLQPKEIELARSDAPPCPVGGRTPPSRPALARRLAQIRARGHDIAHGELISPQTVGAAAPIFGPNRRIFGNLAVAANRSRWTEEVERLAVDLLIDKTRQISRLLGDTAPEPAT